MPLTEILTKNAGRGTGWLDIGTNAVTPWQLTSHRLTDLLKYWSVKINDNKSGSRSQPDRLWQILLPHPSAYLIRK